MGTLSFSSVQSQNEPVITHGPILGKVGSNEIGVWARTHEPGYFWVRYGTGPDNLDQISEKVITKLDNDNTGWILIKDLDADTKYYYALTVKGDNTVMYNRTGSFRTLPDSEVVKDAETNPDGLFNFSFEFACGNSQSNDGSRYDLPTFRTMLDKMSRSDLNINFAVLNGDWLYERNRQYPVDSWREQVGISYDETPEIVELAPKIVGLWENYKSYLNTGHNLRQWHKNVPSFFTIDDHEIFDNTYGAGHIGRVDHKVPYRDPAVQAWHDYLAWSNPTEFSQPPYFGRAKLKKNSDILEDKNTDFTKLDMDQAATLHIHWGGPYDGMRRIPQGTKPGNPNSGVYEIVEVIDAHHIRINPSTKEKGNPIYSIGRRNYGKMTVSNSDLIYLDVRSHQDMHDTSDPYKPGISIMGEEQKAWLKDVMSKSNAEFFFVFSSVNFTVPHEGGSAPSPEGKSSDQAGRDDAWTSYIEERKEMIDFWESLGKPVFLLTGDLHNSFAIKVTDNVWEFASGPHNSRNHPLRSEGNRPVNGIYNSRGREVDIKWSTAHLNDVPGRLRYTPSYCVVQVNNVYNNPVEEGEDRWVAFPRPHVIFQYYDGLTGDLLYAEPIHSTSK